MKIRICGVAIVLAVLVGCAGLTRVANDHTALARAAVQVATVEFLAKNPKHQAKLVAIATEVGQAVAAGQLATLDVAAVYVRQQIDYSRLSPAEAVLLDNLIEVAKEEFARILAAKGLTLPDEQRALVAQVLQWIADAGRLVGGPA